MPKSSKKRKEKAADFAKAKLKLGKGKQLASNAIDTSFKARSIALPTQSITVDKDTATYTTKKKLTFDDLVSHLKHYNAGTRKDAILGLRELLEAYPGLISELLTLIIGSCVRLMSDEDSSVRKTLLAFLQWLVPQIPVEELIPHSPVILLFATSAQTHIFPEIRLDAIKFLDLFLETIPQIVVEGWSDPGNTHGRRILDGYFGLLNAGSKFGEGGDNGPIRATSTASVVLSAASKLIVLRSLALFLRQATSNSPLPLSSQSLYSATPVWYMASSFATPEAYHAFETALQASSSSVSASRQWTPEGDKYLAGQFSFAQNFDEPPFTLHELSDISHANFGVSDPKASGVADRPEVIYVSHLSHTLHPIMVSTFLDCAPSVFSPGTPPPETELQLVITFAEICRTLYNVLLQGEASSETGRACDELKAILGYMSPYFPFHAGSTKRDLKVEQSIQDLNLIYCELTSLLILADWEPVSGKGKSRAPLKGKGAPKTSTISLPIDRVSQYVARLLQGESDSSNGLSRPITHSAYIALLPTIWSLINSSSHSELANEVLGHTVDHAMKISSASAVKKATIDFIGRLILLRTESQYLGSFRAIEAEVKLDEWIIQLPKTLWELGSNHLASTEVLLRFMLRLFQRKGCKVEAMNSVCSRLMPYFKISHPTRGELPGPYCKLPLEYRRLVLDVLATLSSLPNVQTGDLREVVTNSLSDEDDLGYYTQTSLSL